MKQFIYAAASAAALVVASVGAQSATFTGSYDVNMNADENNGLGIQTANLFNLGTGFNLDTVNSTKTFDLFRIWTNEGAINSDDFNARNVSVDFDFLLPSAVSGSIPGQTVGDGDPAYFLGFFLGWVNDHGDLTWSAPKVFGFADGTQLQVELKDTSFNWGVFDLHEGRKHGANVQATFTLLPAVPEPATWAMMIAGLGLVGFTMRRRTTSVQFA